MANSFKNMMREVMAMAHRAFELKSATMSWSECLKQAWAVLKLKLAMKKRVVEFYFQKVDGSIRQAFGTLQESLIDYTPNGKGYACKDCVKYWDIEKKAWRQLKFFNFIKVAA